jgi:hypothetical protein
MLAAAAAFRKQGETQSMARAFSLASMAPAMSVYG